MHVMLIQPGLEVPEHYCPPLGICYLAAVLLESGHEVSVLDMDAEVIDVSDAVALVDRLSPRLIGITSTVANATNARRLGAALKGYSVVHGGPEPTVSPERYLFANPSSHVLRGEAERSLVELVHRLDQGTSTEDVTGLSYLTEYGVRHNAISKPKMDLDGLPLPARQLTSMSKYGAELHRQRATSIMASRSCPYRCTFCYDGIHSDWYRRRSPANVVREIRILVRDFKIRAFYFYDCTLTVESEWVHRFCHQILDEHLDIIWQCMSRAGSLDLSTLQLMRKAGCVCIAAGVESGSERSLRRMRKGLRVEQIERFVANVKAANIKARVYLMLGFPWETIEDFEDTVRLVRRIAPDEAAVSFVTPFHGTQLYRTVIDRYPTRIHYGCGTMREPAFTTSEFSADDLLAYRDRILAAVENRGSCHA